MLLWRPYLPNFKCRLGRLELQLKWVRMQASMASQWGQPLCGILKHTYFGRCKISLNSNYQILNKKFLKSFSIRHKIRFEMNFGSITVCNPHAAPHSPKSGLISDFFFHFGSNLQIMCQITPLSFSPKEKWCSGEWFGKHFWRSAPKWIKFWY